MTHVTHLQIELDESKLRQLMAKAVAEHLGAVTAEQLGIVAASGQHVYLSTGCFHGEHTYCASMVGVQGAKRPAQCKFCEARCVCPCHAEVSTS